MPETNRDPYATVADFYDAEFDGATADADFYDGALGRGRVLVAGCGPGRITRILARNREVVGLDRSEPMLAVARSRGGGARYVSGDITTFGDLGRFEAVVLPNATFNFLPDRASQSACLARCRDALVPGGDLWLDLPAPDFALLGTPHTPERPAWEGRVGDRIATRTREVRRDMGIQRITLTDRYFLDGQFAAEAILELRLVFDAELEWMLEACGFYADAIFGDYGGNPVNDRSPRRIVRARSL